MPNVFNRTVHASGLGTKIAVELNVIDRLGDLLAATAPSPPITRVVLISDETVSGLFGSRVVTSLRTVGWRVLEHTVTPGEASKSLPALEAIYQVLSRNNIDRDAVVVALGGGVVSDLAGFAAGTWMRGVRFAVCPTTVEAMVDASLGGKTGINLPGGKNLVGVFHQPVLVAVDPGCLNTLPPRDVRAGLAESIKHALITAEEFLAWHEERCDTIMSLDPTITAELISRNLRIKAAIVEEDVRETTGRRMLLNFGHTVGHAIESCCGFSLRHGECVALGMLAACRLSRALGLLDSSTVDRVAVLLGRFGLPTRLEPAIAVEEILAAMRNDKKASGGSPRFVLLTGVGRPVTRGDVPESQVREVFESLLG